MSGKGSVVNAFTDPIIAFESISAGHKRYRLVLTDVRMPKLNGVELARRLNEIDKNIKLILMSAFEQTDIDFSLQHEFLQKPIHIETLRKKILSNGE